jgi:hypothetical protein
MVYCSRVGLSLGHLYGCDPLLEDLFWVHVKVGILCPRVINRLLRPCLVPRKFCKIFQILRHIESLDTCMEY